jgi:glycosyltransferase involved in cell wall biosynthesis
MKILIISTEYFPKIGGLETHVQTLAEGMAFQGHEVSIFTNRPSQDTPEKETINNVTIYRAHRWKNNIFVDHKIPWEEAFFGLLEDFSVFFADKQFDLIHAHTQAGAFVGSMVKKSLSCPLVLSLHETSTETEPFGFSRSQLMLQHLPIDHVIAGSKFFYKKALSFGYPEDRISLVYMGIQIPESISSSSHDSLCSYLGINESAFVLTLIGRYKSRKRQIEVLEKLQDMLKHDPDLYLLMVGSCNSASPEYFDKLCALRTEFKLADKVFILRDVPQSRMELFLSGTDLLLQPSREEGLGLAVLEAMARQTAVMVSNNSGLVEIVEDKKTGFISKDMAEMPELIARVKNSPDLLKDISKAGLSLVKEKFCAKNMASENLAIYKKIIMDS